MKKQFLTILSATLLLGAAETQAQTKLQLTISGT
jgi:hypothetical protein